MMFLEGLSSKKTFRKSFVRGIQEVTFLASVDTRGNVHGQTEGKEQI